MKRKLESVYSLYNKRAFVHPDPVEFLYTYPDIRDREIVALIASCLAYGNVRQILNSVALVLGRMTPSPYIFLKTADDEKVIETFTGFKHRFTTDTELIALLCAIRDILFRYDSLQRCFLCGYSTEHETVLPAVSTFVQSLYDRMRVAKSSLLPVPSRGSACKRLFLFLRWMVRCDEVDPGGWDDISPAQLIVPLDVHMHRICRTLGFTQRNQGSLVCALEVTKSFRAYVPDDPVKYDFALTRYGIKKLRMSIEEFMDSGDE